MPDNNIIQTSNLTQTFQALRSRDPQKIERQVMEQHPDYRRVPRSNYAPIATVNTGSWGNGMARFASSGSTIYGQPTFFSPVTTPINWQIPSKRLEQYQWARFFYENEPKVAAAIDFYSEFPMSNWEHECKNREVKLYFDRFKRRLKLPKWCRLMSHEIHLLGDCFPFTEVQCETCGGTGKIGSEICEHEGGTLKRIVVLNPDYVEVHTPPLNPDPIISLRPDEELINMVQKKMPGFEKLSPEVRKLISSGQPIRLDNNCVSHLKYGECGYQKYGIGMIRRLFPILSYKTKLMVAQWIVAERLIIPIKVVKVGSDERPAGPADIAAVQAQLAETSNDPNVTIVTHNAFEMDWVGSCYDDETEVLTENGWKKYADVSKNKDEKIATYNLSNNHIEYQIPEEYHEYDFDGEMCLFESKHYNTCVTPNHRMLVQERIWNPKKNKYNHSEWKVVRADNVKENSRFKTTVSWNGSIPEIPPYKNEYLLKDLSMDDYLKFVGYYLSEGGLKKNKGIINAVTITQKEDNKCFSSIKDCAKKIDSYLQEAEDTRCSPSCWQFIFNNSDFAREVAVNYGEGSATKVIPKWILDLPQRELKIILNALMEGDGHIKFKDDNMITFKYTTVSKELSNGVQEIVLKLGFDPKISETEMDNSIHKKRYDVLWSQGIKENNFRSVKGRNIKRKKYTGKVWCFTVPNSFFITRRDGKISVHGNSGKVLTLSNELEFINQEILDGMMINNALLNGEGPNFCHSDDTRILTNHGLKYRSELDVENDLIATFNKDTGALEYQKAIRKWEYDYNSIDGKDKPMKRFLTNRMDILVTPNHRMLYSPRKGEGFGEWQVAEASEIKERSRFRACFDKWNGKTIEDKKIFGIEPMDFVKIIGWYASEGWRTVDKNRNNKIYCVGIAQSPTANPEVYSNIKSVLQKYDLYRVYPSRKDAFIISNSMNKNLVKYLYENVGEGSNSKRIPEDIKNSDQETLKVLLSALVDGDGSERPATKKTETEKKYYSYTTVSTQLRDDVIEILFKLGFSPRFSVIKFDSPNLQTQYTISWSGESTIGKFPVLASRDMTVSPQKQKQVIFDEDYIGKVWCVEVPNHFIITERNGLFSINGNSSAAVGIEAMIQRLTTFRETITDWLEEYIYIPEARRQGFVDKNPETGEEEVLIPKIKWNSMHLRDQQQFRTFVMQLYEKGLLSAQTVLETFDFDPDQEIERKRYDALQMSALGQGAGQGAGGGGGMGGGGGGMGGLPPPMGGEGGGAPIGAPGEGGGVTPGEGPSAPAGGAPVISKSSSIVAEIADPSQYGNKVLKKKTREQIASEQQKAQSMYEKQQQKAQQAANPTSGTQRDEKGRIIWTKAERDLIPHLRRAQKDGLFGDIALNAQFRVSSGDSEYAIDFAFPALKIGIEADGEIFHSAPKQETHDKERDMNLAQQGWTILRFTDTEIEKKPQQVIQQIIKAVMQKQMVAKNMAKENG